MARVLRMLGVAAAMAGLLLAAGCDTAPSGNLQLTGSMGNQTTVIKVPVIPEPSADTEIGFGTDETTPTPEAPSLAESPDSLWMRIAEIPVSVGDTVSEGDVLVELDGTLLAAAARSAQADAEKSRADLALLGGRLDEISEGLVDIETQRSDLETAVAELEEQRDELLVQLEAARRLVGSPVPTGTPDPAETVVELEEAIEGVDEGLDEARDGLTLLDETGGQLGSAVTAIEGAQKAARAMVRGRDVAVQIAEAHLSHASVLAPDSGVILELPRRGDVLAPGAPLVLMRPDGATSVTTWITAEQRERITLGAAAAVTSDSTGEPLTGAVSDIGDEYVYAPTTFATKIIHLNRAFEVTVIVYGDEAPPPGTPVDVTIETLDRLGS